MNTTTAPLNIVAIGRAVSLVQKPMQAIRGAAKEFGIAPAMVINGVEHYRTVDVESIAERLYEGVKR